MRRHLKTVKMLFVGFAIVVIGCNNQTIKQNPEQKDTNQVSETQKLLNKYVSYKLTTDLSKLSEKEKQMLPLLFEAAKIMDDLHWKTALGDNKDEMLSKITDEATKKLFMINYGPWDRLGGNTPFISGTGEKPSGANFYPKDMTKEEFEAFEDKTKTSLYTLIRRDETGKLISIPYHVAFKDELQKASDLLKKASELAEDKGLKKYLELRAKALITSDYYASDMAWMDMKSNNIEFVIGPIENYEDHLFEYKAAFEAFILIKDNEWSGKLAKFSTLLPILQKELPVADIYKQESPGTSSDLGAYDAIYYAGDCNAGSKTIAINLPNDEKVQLAKGSRRLQLKNPMQAKFENILVPISKSLVAVDQQNNIKFDAFFTNVMFHEVAHGLGIKNTLNKKGTVRDALKETYSAIEECKADILGLWLVTKLHEKGEIKGEIIDNYVTFLAGIFRSVRFGASSSHAKSNLIQFNYFLEKGAFTINQDGTYSVNFDKMKQAVDSLAGLIIKMQGDGDYNVAVKFLEDMVVIPTQLQKALDKLKDSNIPVDVVWEQGPEVVGIK